MPDMRKNAGTISHHVVLHVQGGPKMAQFLVRLNFI